MGTVVQFNPRTTTAFTARENTLRAMLADNAELLRSLNIDNHQRAACVAQAEAIDEILAV